MTNCHLAPNYGCFQPHRGYASRLESSLYLKDAFTSFQTSSEVTYIPGPTAI